MNLTQRKIIDALADDFLEENRHLDEKAFLGALGAWIIRPLEENDAGDAERRFARELYRETFRRWKASRD